MPGTGVKGEKDMSEKTAYTDAPHSIASSILEEDRIPDFLPPPDQLVRKSPKIKVTITLSSKSVDFFKKSAKKNNVKYQTMINEVLDQYAEAYGNTV